jgi:TPR repeat protein
VTTLTKLSEGARRGVVWAGILVALAGPAAGQQAKPAVTLTVAPLILAEPGAETPLAIVVTPAEGVPKNSFLRLRGLPPAASLSEGHAISAGSWAVPLASLPNLKVQTPVAAQGRTEVSIALMAIDGATLAEAKTSLMVAAAAMLAPPATRTEPPAKSNMAALGAPPAPPQPSPPVPNLVARPAPPAAAPVPVAPPAAALAPADRERADRLMKRGDDQMREGDVSAARLFYQRAADVGYAPAAMALAQTFDPDELARLGVRGLQPDLASARRWYERARDLGAADAGERLRRLGAR